MVSINWSIIILAVITAFFTVFMLKISSVYYLKQLKKELRVFINEYSKNKTKLEEEKDENICNLVRDIAKEIEGHINKNRKD